MISPGVLDIDRRGVAAELARANLAPYFSPNLVDMLAERDALCGGRRLQSAAQFRARFVREAGTGPHASKRQRQRLACIIAAACPLTHAFLDHHVATRWLLIHMPRVGWLKL